MAENPVVYGRDDRIEVFEAPARIQQLARSTAVQIPNDKITPSTIGSGFSDIANQTFAKWLEVKIEPKADKQTEQCSNNPQQTICSSAHLQVSSGPKIIEMCSEERFGDQPNPGNCSGFLIAPDLLVTAGHCATGPKDCSDFLWVFDYQIKNNNSKAPTSISHSNIYKCKKIVSATLINELNIDYGIIQLDRPVFDRTPLEFRSEGKIPNNTNIVVIGYPSGLPAKVVSGAKVRDNSWLYKFSANTDTYGGNSGSAVFNEETLLLEGILVQGEKDFITDPVKQCIRTNYCDDDKCAGEKVSRMTSIPEVMAHKSLLSAAISDDTERLKDLLSLNLYVDFRTKDGVSALMKASANAKEAAVQLLLDNGADPNTIDAHGESSIHYLAKVLAPSHGEILNTLVLKKANLNLKNRVGKTPVHIAAETRNLAGVKLLIQMGADAHAQNLEGQTVLHTVAKLGDKKSFQELQKFGLKDSKDHSGQYAKTLLNKKLQSLK